MPARKARPAEARSYEHPQRAADIVSGETPIGRLFEFHPRLVETGRAAVLDLDLSAVKKLQPSAERAINPLRRFPTSAFDLTVIAPARASIGEIESRIATLAGDALVSIAFLRDFAGLDGSRSLSYRITTGASDRTLASDEVSAIRARIIAGLRAGGLRAEGVTGLDILTREVIACERCPRLREYCERVAETKRRAYRDWNYWGKPIPGFGDPKARLLVIGLAPAAHGGNRTGRVFTGDRSGDFLFRALYETGFASQPESVSRDDGMQLIRRLHLPPPCAARRRITNRIPTNSAIADRTWNASSIC